MTKSILGFLLATSMLLATETPAPKPPEPSISDLRFSAEHARMEFYQLQASFLQLSATVDAKRVEVEAKIKILSDKCGEAKGTWSGGDLTCAPAPVVTPVAKDKKEK